MSQLPVAQARTAPRHWSVIDAVVTLFGAWRRRRRFARLQALSDTQLRDIGLTRADIRWGLSLPVSVDATRLVARRNASATAVTDAKVS